MRLEDGMRWSEGEDVGRMGMRILRVRARWAGRQGAPMRLAPMQCWAALRGASRRSRGQAGAPRRAAGDPTTGQASSYPRAGYQTGQEVPVRLQARLPAGQTGGRLHGRQAAAPTGVQAQAQVGFLGAGSGIGTGELPGRLPCEGSRANPNPDPNPNHDRLPCEGSRAAGIVFDEEGVARDLR